VRVLCSNYDAEVFLSYFLLPTTDNRQSTTSSLCKMVLSPEFVFILHTRTHPSLSSSSSSWSSSSCSLGLVIFFAVFFTQSSSSLDCAHKSVSNLPYDDSSPHAPSNLHRPLSNWKWRWRWSLHLLNACLARQMLIIPLPGSHSGQIWCVNHQGSWNRSPKPRTNISCSKH
jgi:hypothetical protein